MISKLELEALVERNSPQHAASEHRVDREVVLETIVERRKPPQHAEPEHKAGREIVPEAVAEKKDSPQHAAPVALAVAREIEIVIEARRQKRNPRKAGCTLLTGRIGHPVPDSDSGAVQSPRCLRHMWETANAALEHEADREIVLETVAKERESSRQEAPEYEASHC